MIDEHTQPKNSESPPRNRHSNGDSARQAHDRAKIPRNSYPHFKDIHRNGQTDGSADKTTEGDRPSPEEHESAIEQASLPYPEAGFQFRCGRGLSDVLRHEDGSVFG